jgi:hypothetical protein
MPPVSLCQEEAVSRQPSAFGLIKTAASPKAKQKADG